MNEQTNEFYLPKGQATVDKITATNADIKVTSDMVQGAFEKFSKKYHPFAIRYNEDKTQA